MSRSFSTGTLRIGLALVDPLAFDPALIEALGAAHVTATFFVRPEVLVLESVRWRFVRAAGHELGNGCLLGVTDDGRLPNWTFATLEAELRDCGELLAELGQQNVASIYLPGRFHVCADGRYRQKLQAVFDLTVGDIERSASLRGVCGAFDLLSPSAAPSGRSAVYRVRPEADELRQFLARAHEWAVGPVSALLELNPHT